MSLYELESYVYDIHSKTQEEMIVLLKRVTEKHDMKALCYDNVAPILTEMWDAFGVIEKELDDIRRKL